MTYDEVIDDAIAEIHALHPHAVITKQNALRYVSQGISKIQKETWAVKRTLDITTASLDAEGSIALNADIAKIERVEFLLTGSTTPVKVKLVDASFYRKLVDGVDNSEVDLQVDGTPVISRFMMQEAGRLWFYPFTAAGTITLYYYPKLAIYSASRAALATGDWADWDSDFTNKLATETIPAEFEVVEPELTMYVAAKLITTIPGWKKLFGDTYKEWMATFYDCFDDVRQDKPTPTADAAPAHYQPFG